MVNGPSPGPAPADQARASSSQLTRSSWWTWPHRKLRRKVPRGCRQKSLLQIITARSWQMARYDAALLA